MSSITLRTTILYCTFHDDHRPPRYSKKKQEALAVKQSCGCVRHLLIGNICVSLSVRLSTLEIHISPLTWPVNVDISSHSAMGPPTIPFRFYDIHPTCKAKINPSRRPAIAPAAYGEWSIKWNRHTKTNIHSSDRIEKEIQEIFSNRSSYILSSIMNRIRVNKWSDCSQTERSWLTHSQGKNTVQ